MSPEQATGQPVDKRADVWAFGCVLYEMLTCERAFAGNTISETLAAVLKEAPDIARTPIRVRRLLEACSAETCGYIRRQRWARLRPHRLDRDDLFEQRHHPIPLAPTPAGWSSLKACPQIGRRASVAFTDEAERR